MARFGFVRACVLAMVTVLAVGICSRAAAQVAPSIVIQPWEEGPHWAETFDDLMFTNKGHLKGEPHGLKVFYWNSYGRVKLDRETQDPGLTFGYRILTISLDSGHPDLPGDLNDVAVVGGFKVGEIDDWDVTAVLGLGTANDGHWGNEDAIYGVGAVDFGHKLDEQSSLHLGLSYDGNRAILPDFPLPYASYQTRVDDTLSFTVGLPVSGFKWKPIEPLELSMKYIIPLDFEGRAAWRFTDWLELFGEYNSATSGFWLEAQENRRLFYEFERVQMGLRFIIDPYVDASVGVGYIFNQEFSRGFDVRSDDHLFDASDEIFLMFRVQGTF